jgi:hypothetical protein
MKYGLFLGRRGLCGTMFIFKIAGAMAEAGTEIYPQF